MKRRTRLIAGLLALVASTFAHAETVRASTCAPAMDMQAAEAVAPGATTEDHMFGASHHGGEDGEDERHCPFGPAAAAHACAGAASLPAHAANQIAPSPEGVVEVLIEQVEHDLLLGDTFFRPPRA